MFHATVYLIVTGAGVETYIKSGGRNFIFMFLCVLFLFEGEKILRSIFNIKSGVRTLGDLATSGAIAWGFAKNAGGVFKRSKGDVGSEDDKNDAKKANDRVKTRRNKQKEDNDAAIAAMDKKTVNGEENASYGEYQGEGNEAEDVSTPKYDGENAKDTILAQSMKRRLKAGMLTKGVNFASGAVGATLGASKSLAMGKGPGDAIAAGMGGKVLGEAIASPVAYGANKLEQLHRGRQMEEAILSGKLDADLGIENIGAISNGDAADFINTTDYESKVDDQQKIYREALAAYAKAAAKGGKAKGEIAYYNYLEKNIKKN